MSGLVLDGEKSNYSGELKYRGRSIWFDVLTYLFLSVLITCILFQTFQMKVTMQSFEEIRRNTLKIQGAVQDLVIQNKALLEEVEKIYNPVNQIAKEPPVVYINDGYRSEAIQQFQLLNNNLNKLIEKMDKIDKKVDRMSNWTRLIKLIRSVHDEN